MKLYVDDERVVPEGWEVARTFHESIYLLERNEYDEVSLDHDLGDQSVYGYREMTGDDILQWLIRRKLEGAYVPKRVNIHTANVAKFGRMNEDVKRYWI